ncbi:hypothetical protein CC80DRAFT_292790 [Byssothecium circinans]|uniref:Extracellular membrane protein CFEM domain-containing protein n=1 Tax=Byssothecium circinans TaxID=147558 RepID=A0A6A5U659_9PLEO|nr:hypothetical protein CC80DRAFT_292790 [Byssothecium circinans]
MHNSYSNKPFLLFFLSALLLARFTAAQIGTVTQEVTTVSGFNLQKPCAQSCFVATGFCPNDLLGSKIGCIERAGCSDTNWQASNDCYCRTDLQKAAQSHLTSCVKAKCTAGDPKIDGSSAGSIYEQYCREKGYSIAAPATVQASATSGSGSGGTARAGSGPAATGDSTTAQTTPQDETKKPMSISTIIGIVVGSLVGLTFLAITLRIVFKWFGCFSGRPSGGNPPVQPQQPLPYNPPAFYPRDMYPEQPYWQQKPLGTESDVGPEDSVSVVRCEGTLVSDVRH